MKKRSVITGGLAVILIVIVAIVIGLGLFLKSRAVGNLIAENLPDMPDLSASTSKLIRRVESANNSILERKKPLEALRRLTRLYHTNGFLAEASQCYEILLVVDSNEARWKHLYASILASYGRLEEAIALWESMIADDSDYIVAYIRQGEAFFKMNEFEKAESVFKKALKIKSGNAYALQGLGRIEMARRNWAKAKDYLEVGVKSSEYRIGTDLLASVYQELGLNDKADYLWREHGYGAYCEMDDPWMIDLLDDCYDPSQLSTAGGAAAFRGDTDLGMKLLEKAARLDDTDPMLFFQLGLLALEMDKLKVAEKYFLKSVELKPDLSDGWFHLMTLYRNVGDEDEALALLKTGFAYCPDSPSLLIEMGNYHASLGSTNRAVKMFERSIELRPNEALAYIQLALIYFQQDNMSEGIRQMEKALVAEPGHTLALTTLTLLAIQSGDKAMAEKYFRKVNLQPRIGEDRKMLEIEFKKQFGHSPIN